MVDITKKISHLIESQFPEYYRESGEELVAFIKAYYEFLETSDEYSVKMSKQMFELTDIDDSVSSFVSHFQNKFLSDFPSIMATDKRFAIKHILDLYSSKGSKNSLALLMKLLYNQEIEVYNPSSDVIKPSDSLWVKPIYIEVSKSSRTRTMLGQQITGSASGAKAFIESIVRKRVDGRFVDVLYLSGVEGTFKRNEKITNDGLLSGAPTIIGSLTTIDITLGGRNNKIGDILDVVTTQAKHGKVRVTEIQNSTGKVDFKLLDGGYGYTSAFMAGTSDFVANTTQVLVATAMLNVENSANSFITYEPVLQRIEKIYLLSATNINGNTNVIGSYLLGKNADGTQVANGMIIAVANTNSLGDTISTPSANSLVTVQVVGDTTFGYQKKLTLTSNVAFATGEYVDEESTYSLTVSSNTGVFTVGDYVKQTVVANGYITGVATGTVLTANSTKIVVKPAWGPFVTGTPLVKTAATTVNCAIDNVETTVLGARGLVTGRLGANVDTRIVYGAFTNGNKIYGNKTKLFGTISSSVDTSAANLYLNGNNSANGIIGAPAGKNNVTKLYANGIIVGQNSTSIGVYGNTYPFYYSNTGTYYVETNREQLISPPRYANNMIIELNAPILAIKTGSGANFKVGYLENTENVQLNTDIVGGNNAVGVPFRDILLTGENSGVGLIASVTVVSGGTGYVNGNIVTFTVGGRAGGDPWIQANASITTNGSGVITTVTVIDPGQGYFTVPTLTLPATSGTVASLTPVMSYGFGFTKNPAGSNTNLIGDLLTNETFLIGSIGTLSKINPGSNYNADPFVRVLNQYIASYGRGDFIIYVDNVLGSFKIGERLEQIISGSETAKGSVISYDVNSKILKVHRTSFNVGFASGIRITGTSSSASADVVNITSDGGARIVGDNAIVSANVIVANGVATKVEVIDSGFGYIQGGGVTLESANNIYVMTGNTNIINQGIGSGYWKTTTSHLNSEKKIHDNKYYQEYSYDIISGLSLDRYEKIVKKILHVAGNELFGSVEIKSSIGLTISSANSSIGNLKNNSVNYLLLGISNLVINGDTLVVSTENEL
jgi:hypothetical protein